MAVILTPANAYLPDKLSVPQLVTIAGGIAPYTAVSSNASIATVSSVTPGPPASFTTLNPLDKNASVALSGGNLVGNTTGAGGGDYGVRAVQAVTTGKWYWEVTCTSYTFADFNIGVANATEALSTYIGSDANGWSYINDGRKFHGGAAGYGAAFTTGDIIGVALDMGAGSLTFYKNGTSQGVAFASGITGTIYPMISMSKNNTFTANFGATAFAYTPPAGYTGVGVATTGTFTVYPVAPGYAAITVTDSTP